MTTNPILSQNGLLAALLVCAMGAAMFGCSDSSGDAAGAESPGGGEEAGEGESSGESEGPGESEETGEGESESPGEQGGQQECQSIEGCDSTICPSEDDQTTVQQAMLDISSGQTLCLAAGTYTFTTELSLAKEDVTLRGAGMDDTILDFSGQIVGANGLKLQANRITVEDFKVLNPKGDGIRAQGITGVAFRRVFVEWEADGSVENGAYGLYPVEASEVLISGCKVKGASDAGVYVGQSVNVIVEDNEAFGNVAGIEIENTTDAEVRGNHVYDNTGGILVFNLPGLPVKDGRRAKVHNNLIESNNRANFAPEGNIVGMVPPGTGILVLASDSNEFHDNTITGNDSLGVGIISYSLLLFDAYDDPDFDPYPAGNYVHNNSFENNGTAPAGIVATLAGGANFAPLAWDGCTDPNAAEPAPTNCFNNNEDATYTNFGLCDGFQSSSDIAPVTCEGTSLPPIELAWP